MTRAGQLDSLELKVILAERVVRRFWLPGPGFVKGSGPMVLPQALLI